MRPGHDQRQQRPDGASAMTAVVIVESLTKRFGRLTAVDDLSFALEPGTITGFLGPTAPARRRRLRVLLGLAAPTSGRALVFGKPYAELERPALRIGAVLEATDFHPGRSGRDHLRTLGRAAGSARRAGRRGAAPGRARRLRPGAASRATRSACASGWDSPRRCSATPSCWSSTSPRTASTPRACAGCATSCALRGRGSHRLISSHVLAEVAQTVDQVLIINRGQAGRRVARSTS